MSVKNIFPFFIVVIFLFSLPPFSFGANLTIEELQRIITQLLHQIEVLQRELSQLKQSGPTYFCYTFDQNLKIGDKGEAVVNLQTALEKEGFSIGNDERGFFGEGTAAAVTGFQQKYANEILTPLGLKYGTGFVGKATRKKLNELYGCKSPSVSSELSKPSPISEPSKSSSITLVSPNGGEVWEVGKVYKIKWNSRGVSQVRIMIVDYRAPEGCMLNGGESISASLGEYSFKFDGSCVVNNMGAYEVISLSLPGDKFKIKIEDVNNPADVFDFSDDYFTIKPLYSPELGQPAPLYSINVIYPNGKEIWQVGEIQSIKWYSRGVSQVKIYLIDERTNQTCMLNNGEPIPVALGKDMEHTYNEYNFKIDGSCLIRRVGGREEVIGLSLPGDKFKIKIEAANNPEFFDVSNDYFTIKPISSSELGSFLPDVKKFIPGNATLVQTFTVDLEGDGIEEIAVAYALPYTSQGPLGKLPLFKNVVFAQGNRYDFTTGIIILKYTNDWKVVFEDIEEVNNLGGPKQAIRIEKVSGPNKKEGVLVIREWAGAGTSSKWHLIASVNGKISKLDPSSIKEKVLAEHEYVFQGYNKIQSTGNFIIETIPGYSKEAPRCCPDKPTIEIKYIFDGNSIKLDSVKEIPS